MANDITKAAGRKALAPRREQYWRQEGNGSIGFRRTGEPGEDTGTWFGRLRVNGKYEVEPFGRLPDYDTAVEKFTRWAEGVERAAKGGVEAGALDLTVADACHHYIAESLKTRGNTRQHAMLRNMLERAIIGREVRRRQGKVIAPHPIAKVKLENLTKGHVRKLRNDLLGGLTEAEATRAQKNTAAATLKCVIAMLNKAHSHELIATDAAWSGLEGYGNTAPDGTESYRYVSPEERAKMVAGMPEGEGRMLAELLCKIGARPVELLRAKVGDYDKKAGILKLETFKGRGGKKKMRPLPIKTFGVVDVLNALVKDKLPTAPLFTMSYQTLRVQMAASTLAGNIEDASCYCFRHSFITDALNRHVPVNFVAQFCGTSAAMIEKTYSKLLTETLENAFNQQPKKGA